jgi:hypothetical protein
LPAAIWRVAVIMPGGLAIVSRIMAAHHGSLHFMRDGPQFIAQLRLPL